MPVAAFDVGPLHGAKTGVGAAVDELLSALRALPDGPSVAPYVVSFRAALAEGERRLRMPAAIAHRWWGRASWPAADRALGNPDVIHGTNYVVPPARCPRLVSVYDCWFLRNDEGVHPDVARAGRVLRRNVADGAVVHVSSQATARQVTELLSPRRVEVVELGAIAVPAPRQQDPAPIPKLIGRRFVLSLGTLERRKNLPTLIRAFGAIHQRHPGVELVLAGSDGNDSAAIAAAIDGLARTAAARVSLTGRLTDDARSWLLHHAAVLAYPSLDEGFGFPLLEAMIAGVPVVASTAGSIPEVAGDAAILVEPLDAAALGEAISQALDDEDVRQRLIAEGRLRAAHFDWAVTARKMSALYDSMIEETP
jgi:glycosyltransferase involved in cell wall biosynthesis